MSVGRLRRLSPATILVAAEALVLAVAIELALRLMPFACVLTRLERLTPRTPARAVDSARFQRIVTAVYGLLPVRSTCLRESLVLLALLRRRGQPARLQIGVSKTSGNLAAHAWVEGTDSGDVTGISQFSPLTPIRPVACSP